MIEHDPDGKWAAKFSDGDYVQHDDLERLFQEAHAMFEARDYLSGDRNVAVTIGPAEAIDFPSVDPKVSRNASSNEPTTK